MYYSVLKKYFRAIKTLNFDEFLYFIVIEDESRYTN